MDGLAFVYAKQDRFAEAEELRKQALDSVTRIRGAEDGMALRYKYLLGDLYLYQGKYAEAEPLLQAANKGAWKHPALASPQEKSFVHETLADLVQLYEKWPKPDEAGKWRRKLEERNQSQSPAAGQPPTPAQAPADTKSAR